MTDKISDKSFEVAWENISAYCGYRMTEDFRLVEAYVSQLKASIKDKEREAARKMLFSVLNDFFESVGERADGPSGVESQVIENWLKAWEKE